MLETDCDPNATETDCDAWPMYNVSMSFSELAAGTYYIVVDGYDAGDMGQYTIDVTVVEILPQNDPCDPNDPYTRCEAGTVCAGQPGQETCQSTTIIFSDDFTTDLSQWTVTDANNDGDTWMWCDPNGACFYGNFTGSPSGGPFALVYDPQGADEDGEMLDTAQLDGTGYTNVFLEFFHNYDDVGGCDDQASVEVSTDGTNWTSMAAYTADSQGYVLLDLSQQVAGSQFYVRFAYDDDTTGNNPCNVEEWRVDDVVISGI
jgi:hypothetical protein